MDLLKFGSRGPRVQFLQLALNRAGFGPVQTDGIFGYATQSAVLRFQTELDLQPDGIVGAITRQALRPWYEGYTTTPRSGALKPPTRVWTLFICPSGKC